MVNPTVYVKNELAIAGTLRVDGLANQDIPVQVLFETAPGKMEVVATLRPRATENSQLLPLNQIYIPETPGEYKLTLRAVPPEGVSELVTTNNELSTFVTVLEGGLRVLYLEGRPREEMAFLRRSLDASPDIQVDAKLFDQRGRERMAGRSAKGIRAGQVRRLHHRRPRLEGLMERRGPENLQALARAINRGAGLIMLGGYHSFWPGGYQSTPLRDVLPIEAGELDRLVRQNFGEPPLKDPNIHLPARSRCCPTSGSRTFRSCSLRRVPKIARPGKSCRRSKGPTAFARSKRGARPLAVTPTGDVLMAALEPGRGRVLAFAGDSTYQWRLHGFDAVHKRFWRQVILWLAHVDEASAGDVWVRLEQRRFSPGQRVEFTAGVKSLEPDVVNNCQTGRRGHPSRRHAASCPADAARRRGHRRGPRHAAGRGLQDRRLRFARHDATGQSRRAIHGPLPGPGARQRLGPADDAGRPVADDRAARACRAPRVAADLLRELRRNAAGDDRPVAEQIHPLGPAGVFSRAGGLVVRRVVSAKALGTCIVKNRSRSCAVETRSNHRHHRPGRVVSRRAVAG